MYKYLVVYAHVCEFYELDGANKILLNIDNKLGIESEIVEVERKIKDEVGFKNIAIINFIELGCEKTKR